MLVLDCYGKNIYLGNKLVGYIDREGEMYILGKPFATLLAEGDIISNDKVVGYIDEGLEIIINNRVAGYVKDDKSLYINPNALDNLG